MGLTRIRAEQISDIDYKQAVRVIALTNITLAGGAPAEVDGVSLVAGDRVLVAGQSNAAQNGLYQVQTVGAGSNGTWVRTSDANQDGEIQPGMVVMVTQGTEYADTPWKLVTNGEIVIGTTELTFEENYSLAFGNIFANGTAVIANAVSAPVTFAAGDNIAITGNNTTKTVTFAVTGITTSRIANGTSNVDIATANGNVTTAVNGNTTLTVASTGANIAGYVTATGNVTGGNLVSASLGSAGNTAIVGTNNALTSTSSLFVDTANNRIGVGTVTPERTFDLVGNAAFTGDVQITQFNDSSDSGGIRIRKSRGADNAPSAVVDADTVGSIEFFLRDTAAFQQRASITSLAQVSGATYGADLAFGTGNGAGPTTRLYIAEGGAITFNGAYTFPTSDGSANNALVTNGAGALSFTGTPTFTSITATGNVTGGNLITAGLISATGNITGNYFIGNGSQLTGIATSAFDLIQVSGQANVDAATSTTLTLVAGDGISITTDAGNTTITFTNTSVESIFATGGDMGLVNQAATDEQDLGLVTVAFTESYDLGSVVQQFAIEGNLAGNLIGNTHSIVDLATLTVLGNAEVGELTTSGNVLPSANVTYNLGSPDKRWNDLWLANSTIHLGEVSISAIGGNLELPATVQIGNVTLSESDGNLSLPENISATTVTATGNITAGNLTPDNALAITYGGTGATDAANALSNLGAASVGKAIAMTIVFG